MSLVQGVYLPEAAWPARSQAVMREKLAAELAWKLGGAREACLATRRVNLLQADRSYPHLALLMPAVSLISMVEMQEGNSRGHAARVALLAERMGEAMGLGAEERSRLRLAGLVHDLGKIDIPESILAKAGLLTIEERQIVERHPLLSATMVSLITGAHDVVEAVLYHHEWWDGTGYPYGLRGETIPLLARILCLADSYDAMICDRPYRLALTCEEAQAELTRGAGTQFDPGMVPLFVAVSRR